MEGVTVTMLADGVEFVIGVDTHKQTHTAAVVDRLGGVSETFEFPVTLAGYRMVLGRVTACGGIRVWGVQGTGSYGAGLCGFLQAAGEHVVEVERPGRPVRRNGAKSDAIDAIRAARQVLTSKHQIEPRHASNDTSPAASTNSSNTPLDSHRSIIYEQRPMLPR